jgi:hypothetical protein
MKAMAILAVSAAVLAPSAAGATTIVFNDFSSTAGLQLNGASAAVNDGTRNVLRVTPSDYDKAGSVFSTSPVTLGADVSFSTRFTFNFNTPLNGGADGVVFTVQTNSSTVGGIGGGIGYMASPTASGSSSTIGSMAHSATRTTTTSGSTSTAISPRSPRCRRLSTSTAARI